MGKARVPPNPILLRYSPIDPGTPRTRKSSNRDETGLIGVFLSLDRRPSTPQHCPVLCQLRPDSAPMSPGRAPEPLCLSYDSPRLTPTHPVLPRSCPDSARPRPGIAPICPNHAMTMPQPRPDSPHLV